MEWRQYTGLDDKTLDVPEKADVASLGEANLDFASVQLMFLPDELERAEAAFDAARSTASADQRWVAGLEQYEPVLDALETPRAAYQIGNSATALGLLGDPGRLGGVQHVEDVADGGVRGVRVGGEGGQGLGPAVLRVALQEPGWAVVVGVDVVDDADQCPARCGGDDGRLIHGGGLNAGPCEMVGVGAEEGQVLGEAQDTAVEFVVVGLLLGQAEQLAPERETGWWPRAAGRRRGRADAGGCGPVGRCDAGPCVPSPADWAAQPARAGTEPAGGPAAGPR
ncbi:hypothetical protein GCM10010339_92820 [Streptomyces alanosinicus]|uniref:Uncharacterized protein n=1 Tax=Streptomyces alanosinicus TaxID=68171 RepID=A0A919D899_9ACTN|nr:hypothetical protein GCM10010339_92820 [Streptomyces alanosinicus]